MEPDRTARWKASSAGTAATACQSFDPYERLDPSLPHQGRQRTSGKTAVERCSWHTEEVTCTIGATKSNLPEWDRIPETWEREDCEHLDIRWRLTANGTSAILYIMADEVDARVIVARKSLADQSPSQRFVEDCVFPWPEVGLPPFGAMTCCISPGERCDPDRHNQDEIVFVYRGHGEIASGGDVWPMSQGDVVFIPRNLEHTFSNTDPEGDFAFFSVWWPRIEPQG